VGDLASGVVGGAAGAAASAIGTSVLGGVLGTGAMLSVAGLGFGIAGYMIADHFLRQTATFQKLKDGAYKTFQGLGG
jgi:hypothetical protein